MWVKLVNMLKAWGDVYDERMRKYLNLMGNVSTFLVRSVFILVPNQDPPPPRGL